MKTLLALVATCAAVFQAGLMVQEWRRPSLGLLRSLRSRDVEERRGAGRGLAALGPEDVQAALPSLVAALGDRDPESRHNVFMALARAVVTASADRLPAQWSPATRREVRDAVAAVLAALADPDEATRLDAAGFLKQFASWPGGWPRPIGDPGPVAARMARVALDDRSGRVRAEAANGLFALAKGSDAAPPADLAAALAAPDRPGDVRGMAAVLLAGFPAGRPTAFPLLVGTLGGRDPGARRGAALGLALCDPAAIRPAIPTLLAVLAEPVADPPSIPDGGVAVRWFGFPAQLGFEVVAAHPPGSRPFPLQEAWDPAGAALAALAAAASGDLADDRVIDALARTLLAERHPWRRQAAASALHALGPRAMPAAPALLEALAKQIKEPESAADKQSLLAFDLIGALVAIAPKTSLAPAVVAVLMDALDSPSAATAAHAINALVRFGPAASPAMPKLRALAAAGKLDLRGLAEQATTRIDANRAGKGETQAIATRAEDRLTLHWPSAPGETGRLILNLAAGQPLLHWGNLGDEATGEVTPLLAGQDPAAFLVVGSRVNPPPTPPEMSVFNVFFDSPAQRPHRAYRVTWAGPKVARVVSEGARATVAVGPIEAGPFRGEWVITVYAGTRLVHVEAVLQTTEDARAITYDAGLVTNVNFDRSKPPLHGQKLAWIDPQGRWHREPVNPDGKDEPRAVRHRAIVLEAGGGGSVACFPPPHQYFFPRDDTDNLATTWSGRDHRGLAPGEFGFGVRQPETGGGRYAPWFNAPPGTEQRLGAFYLLHPGRAEAAMEDVLRFTHGDRFPELPGYKTFSSHYHIAFTVEAMKQKAAGIDPPAIPPLVGVFKGLGVDAVHVAEFHGDGHPFDPGPLRLPELDAMFAECRRISDDRLLVIPGEEANLDLGFGPRSGHWLEMFPRPVRFTMKRPDGRPFEEAGVYHLKTPADLLELLKREKGLAWTAHPRIKASNFAPDIYKDAPFFRDPAWLGAAWKAMPADLSRPRLGDRCLDLLDAMSNWGRRKQLLGEVDVFKLDSTHELYAHMNVNYVKLDRLPRFDDGWQPLLDALRAGRFFVTTGEILLHSATLGGTDFGSTLAQIPADADLNVDLEWTFPLRFAELVSGDGEKIYRDRIDLSSTPPLGRQTLTLRPDLKGRKWARFEVWDIASNGAFTQPIWIGGD